jgi:hypothetical protein
MAILNYLNIYGGINTGNSEVFFRLTTTFVRYWLTKVVKVDKEGNSVGTRALAFFFGKLILQGLGPIIKMGLLSCGK